MNNNLSELVVCIKLKQLYKIPKNSIATIQENPLGTNAINIIQGNGTSMIVSGDTIQSAPATSLLGDLMNELSPIGDQVKNTISSLELVLTNVNKTLNDENRQNFKVILENLSATTINLNKSLASIEGMVNKQNGSIAKTADNLNSFTANLNQNNQKISNILTNLDSTTKSINDADLYKTIKTIQTTLIALNTTINQLNNGNGTASKLLNDPAMYTQLQSTIKSVNTLVDDIKVHPKRYISVSVFGKKDKRTPLTKPLSDTLGHE
jgi:phospholipid/cholesterol/gamma-HCH transport system substrate-binding protein